MALFRCQSGNGGGVSETTLWNIGTVPSSQTSTTANLSQGISNFDEIKVNYRLSQSDNTGSFVTFPTSKFNATYYRYVVGMNVAGVGIMCRYFSYNSDTKIDIGAASQLNAAYTDNEKVIITDFIGINY